jgi:hypothetical protein
MDLLDVWNLMDHSKSVKDCYDQNIRIIGSMKTLDDFNIFKSYPGTESIFYKRLETNELVKPFVIHDNKEREISAVSMFKNGIEPKWEHPVNSFGGEIQCKFSEHKPFNTTISTEELDKMWYLLVLCTISGKFSAHKYITGIRIVDHTNPDIGKIGFRIEIWFSKMGTEDIKILEKEVKLFIKYDDKTIVKMHR